MMDEQRDRLAVAQEAEMILKSAVFQDAVRQLRSDAIEVMLHASGVDAVLTMTENRNLVNAIDGMVRRIEMQMKMAQRDMKPRVIGA